MESVWDARSEAEESIPDPWASFSQAEEPRPQQPRVEVFTDVWCFLVQSTRTVYY